MLKNNEIIEKLKTVEKVALVTDFFKCMSESSLKGAGLPVVLTASLDELNEKSEEFIPFETIASTWNTELMYQRTRELASSAYNEGIRLVTTPDIRTATDPYAAGLSEDPYFCGTMGGAMIKGAHGAGMAVGVKKLSISETDLRCLDLAEDERAIYDLFIKPFIYASREKFDAIFADLNHLNKEYFDTNIKLFVKAESGYFGDHVLTVSENTEPDLDFHTYLDGNAIIGKMSLKLNEAVEKYKKLSIYKNEGTINQRDFDDAIETGTAIDENALDEAVDRIIDFINHVNSFTHNEYEHSDDIGLQVALESIVMLKNYKSVLPLKRGVRLGVIGVDKYIEQLDEEFDVMGFARGYDRYAQRSELLIPEALQLAKISDVVLVFLEPDKTALTMPANRIALARALKGVNKKMIAVISGNLPIDLSFDSLFDGVLLMPECKFSGEALTKILRGMVSPSGKLTRTHYDGADNHFRRHRDSVETGRMRIGSFVGYRYYDSVKKPIRYHFGFGLSYTQFDYSDLRIEGGRLTFNLKNKGTVDGAEVVQVYVSNLSKTSIDPNKELKAFTKVFLKAGQTKTVELKLPLSSFKSFNHSTGGESVEAGTYTVYVGSSVSDIRLSAKVTLSGDNRESTGEKAKDYFVNEGRIERKYKLASVPVTLPHKNLRVAKFIGTAALPLFVFIIALMLLMYLTDTGDAITEIVIIMQLTGLALIDSVFLLIARGAIKKADKREYDGELHIMDASSYSVTPERLFDIAFGDVITKQITVNDEEEDKFSFDKTATFDILCHDLKIFLSERGVEAEDTELINIISAMAASRLIIVPRGENLNLFAVISQFFGKEMFTGNADSLLYGSYSYYRSGNNKFFEHSNIGLAIESSRIETAHLHFGYISHVAEDTALDILGPIVDELRIRKSFTSTGEDALAFPENLWIIAEFEDVESLKRLPGEIAEAASVIIPQCRKSEPTQEKTIIKPFGFNQFSTLVKFVRIEYPLPEKLWKYVDRLEEMINKARFYRIDNKLWIKTEKYCSTYLACGGSDIEALGAAVATQLIPRFVRLWDTSANGDINDILEDLLGINAMSFCKVFFDTTNYKVKKENIV